MAGRWKNKLRERDVTPEAIWLNRRALLGGLAGASVLAAVAPGRAQAETLEPNRWEEITAYNNFYEFGTAKDDPAKYAGQLTVKPWSIKIDGMVDNPGDYALEDILAKMVVEERIYRFRCVEAWSMTIPWSGFALKKILSFVEPKISAKFLRFETFFDPDVAPGQKQNWYPWPYVEGITIDEAKNDLSFLATGIYGKELPNQNGAPLRLVLPWKYGFKSIKSIVKISFVDKKPQGMWERIAPLEYGFWANVNPNVPHPRWSQSTEQQLGVDNRVPTMIYNGYGSEVASMYKTLQPTLKNSLFR